MLSLLVVHLLLVGVAGTAHAAGQLEVTISAGPNFVVDSNVTSPSTFAPEIATISGRACNIGDAALSGVQMKIGDQAANTPGTYPVRDSATAGFVAEHPQLAHTGLYSFTHIGDVVDATRWVGTLAPGECARQYWHLTYPRRGNPNNTGAPVFGVSNVTADDLWLEYDIWAVSAEGPSDTETATGTMRSEISANANKIFPSGGTWFNTNLDTVEPGETVTSNGVNYDLGIVNKGFDNDGDLLFDYNAWLQPVGDPSFDPTCLRLIKTWGTLTISRSGGNPDQIINFEDELYFTHLPPDNNGVTGEVHYQYLALRGDCSVSLSPYQESASGSNTEKFSGDYGVGLPVIGTTPAEATFSKAVDLAEIAAGGTLSYDLMVTNTGAQDLGRPDLGMPIVLVDTIPSNASYVAGSASTTLGYSPSTAASILFSTDGGQSWATTEPVPASGVTDIQWWLSDALPSTGTVTGSFDVTVDSPFSGPPFVENTGGTSFGGAPAFLEDSAVTLVLGTNTVGDTVWRDDDQDATKDAGEPGIANVDVELYWDKNGDGAMDSGDILVRTTATDSLGAYSFASLPDGDFLIRVDRSDPDFPFGYTATTDEIAVATDLGGALASPWNDADFGYLPSLIVTKTLTTPDPALEGQLVSYSIDLQNTRGPVGGCQLTAWTTTLDTSVTSGWANQSNGVDDIHGPNGTFTSASFGLANPDYGVLDFDFGSQSGTIQKVELLLPLYLDQALVDDFIEVVYPDASATEVVNTVDTAQLNTYAPIANAGTIALDVTSGRTWSWSTFPDPAFFVRIDTKKRQSSDAALLFVDAIGFRVTADTCSGAGADTMSPLPLSDVFDADLLEFVSADMDPTSVTYGATPYANTGTLSWSDVGPVSGGQSKLLNVTFRALQPPDADSDGEPDSASTTNTATSTGGHFLNGDPVNTATDTATVGIDPAGTIGDTVFADNGNGGGTASNGVQEAGEPGIPYTTVELWSDPNGNGDHGDDGVLADSQTTDATGTYLFTAVTDGNWVVVVIPPSLPGATWTATGDPDEAGVCTVCNDRGSAVINSHNGSTANDDDLSLDFGYIIPNTIFGSLWNDHDGDAVQDDGENGIGGVTIQVQDCGVDAICGNGDDGATRFTTTGADGSWTQSDLPDGNYQAVVDTTTLPAGGTWTQTVDTDVTLDDRTTATQTLAGGALSGHHDFAYTQSGNSTLGDTVFVDWNANGTEEVAEEGIGSVTVWLYEDQDGDGAVNHATDALVATTVTAADGSYSFSNLPAGNWIVVVDLADPDLPAGAILTADPDQPGLCSACDSRASAITDGTASVTTLDFGYQPTGTARIGDTVFADDDGDGVLDPTEIGLENIRVVLFEDTNANGVIDASDAVVRVASTDASGHYEFSGLAAGRYLVDVDELDSDLPNDGNGNRYTLTTQNDEELVVLTTGETRTDLDFGFAPGGSIGNGVWRDDDRDSLQDAEEPGVPNATVNLYVDVNQNGVYDAGTDTLYTSAVTDALGQYEFVSLPSDYYVVVLDLTDPDLPSSTVTGDPDESGPCIVCDGEFGFFLPPTNIVKYADIGVMAPGVIGDTVWLDANSDGVYDPVTENGLYFVQVDLLDNLGAVIDTTNTDADGHYAFADLADGNYTVRVMTGTLPPNVVLGYDPDEGNNCTVCDHRGAVTIASGNVDNTIDFGYRVGAATNLTIQKTSSAGGGPVNPGAAINYTIVVTNTGTAPATQIAVSDPIPAGASFVPPSSVTAPVSVVSDYRDDFTATYPAAYNGSDGAIDWTPQAWAEISDDGVTTTGDVTIATDLGDLSMRIARAGNGAQRAFDLTGAASAEISLEYRRINFSAASDFVNLDVSYDNGASWTTLGSFGGAGTDAAYVARSYTLPPASYNDGNPADNLLRLLSSGLKSNGSEYLWADAIKVETTTRQLQTVAGNSPPLVVAVSDGYTLLGGESMTINLSVQVDNPPAAGLSQILNQAGAVSLETINPVFDLAIDKLASGGALGDRVWLDADGDGVQDIGEPGLANVTVELWDAGADNAVGGGDDTLVATAQTDLEGAYLFSALGPGVYFVAVDDTTRPSGLSLSGTVTDPSTTRTVIANEEARDLDFGYAPTDTTAATIGDRVWSDGDGDGIQDPGEVGIRGVTIHLNNASGTTVSSTTTAADGSYLFTGVTPGDYTVAVAAADLASGGVLDGYSATVGAQSIGGSTSPPLSVNPSTVYLQADFGFSSASTYEIRDRVWFDANANGLVDVGESGIPDVSINLLDDQGRVVATVASASDGSFSFDGVATGSYTIQMSDNYLELLGLTGTTAAGLAFEKGVLLASADLAASSFGYNVPGAVGDRLFSDADGDGVHDPGEPGISGATVTLWTDVDGNGVLDTTVDTLHATTLTDASGWYRFEGLAGGTWFASVDGSQAALAAYTATTSDQETGPNAAGVQIEAVLISSAAGYLDADFGFRNNALADISGNVFNDLDLDGIDDGAAEPGFAAVTLDLHDSGGVVIASVITDASGDYTFYDLPAGTYSVRVTDEAGALRDAVLTSGFDELPIVLSSSNVTGVDFGYNRTEEAGAIGDRVWFDADRDGILDSSESGLPLVTLELYEDDGDGLYDAGDTLVASVETDINGRYRFDGLTAGTYFVDPDESTLASGFAATTGTGAVSGAIALSEAEFYDRADFGYAPSTGSSIGDTVFFDRDGDGFQDPGEAGIAGVKVTITGPGGYSTVVTTGADGRYLATGVTTTGGYTAAVDTTTLPAGFDPQPTIYPSATISFGVTAGTDWLFADFGFRELVAGSTAATVGDLVFVDLDGNGSFDGSDFGLEDVTVDLLNDSGVVIASSVTDASGNYDFSGILAGDYQVAVSDAAGALWGLNLTAGSDPTATITLAAGDDYNLADFGYAPSGGSGAIGDLVWHDKNDDGDLDADESGIEGVTLRLWHDTNANGVLDVGIDNLLRSAVTNSNGGYFFLGLPAPASYLVELTDVVSVLESLARTTGAVNVNDNSQQNPHPVTLTSSRAPTSLVSDFGYSVSGTSYAISGVTYFDNDGDATLEPPLERGIGGNAVFLFRDLDGDGVLDASDPLFGSTTSAADGSYTFAGLPANSDWIIAVDTTGTFLAGSQQTTQTGTAAVQPVAIAAANVPNQHFGFTRPATEVLLTRFEARLQSGGAVVEWETASENGTLGFDLYRAAPDGSWVRVNEHLIVADPSAYAGASYAVLDGAADPAVVSTYLLEEIEVGSRVKSYGPFRVTASGAVSRFLDDDVLVTPHGATALDAQRLAERRAAGLARRVSLERSAGGASGLLLETDEVGLYRVPAAQLASFFDLTLDEVRARLANGSFRLRNQYAGHRRRNGVGWFSRGDALFFWAEAAGSMSAWNAYALDLAPGSVGTVLPGGRATSGQARWVSTRTRVEQNVFAATAAARDPYSEFWFQAVLVGSHPAAGSRTVEIGAPGLSAAAHTAEVTLALFAATESLADTDHHLTLYANGQHAGSVSFDGRGRHEVRFSLPSRHLEPGTNTLELVATRPDGVPSSIFYLDSVELRYLSVPTVGAEGLLFTTVSVEPTVLDGFVDQNIVVADVTEPDLPRLIEMEVQAGTSAPFAVHFVPEQSGHLIFAAQAAAVAEPRYRAMAGAELTDPDDGGAEYLVIAPESLVAGAEDLAEMKRSTGLSARVVTLESIFDGFALGTPEPDALRRFLGHAWSTWRTPPRYAVLVGKGSFDYRDHRGLGTNLVPPLLIETPNGLYASDMVLGDVDGDDAVPEVVVGRIPVLTNEELGLYLDKLAAAHAGASGADRVLLLADDGDQAGDFAADSDRIWAEVPQSLSSERVYLDQIGADAARAAVRERLDDGLLWLNYIGHGGLDRLTAEGVLTTADVASLAGRGRLPVVTSLTCSVGRFEFPGLTALSEALVVVPDRGALAVWGPSGLSVNSAAVDLDASLTEYLFDPASESLGAAIRRALEAFPHESSIPHLPRIYNLIGDPALPLDAFQGGEVPDLPVLFADDFESGGVEAWSLVR